jgi:hypothetical protein
MPIEALHSLENGIFTMCLDLLFNHMLKPKQRIELDMLAKAMGFCDRQFYLSSGAQKGMPALLWKNGISSITMTTAANKVGLMLTVVVISLTEEGKAFFERALGATKLLKMRQCFQMLLSYWMWLKKDSYWTKGDEHTKNEYLESIRTLLKDLKELWPRKIKNGWDTAKFHEQLHVPDDIERNGAPSNTHSGPTEHNHIEFVKNPAKRTQRKLSNLDKQISERYAESQIIKMAHAAINGKLNEKPKPTNEENYTAETKVRTSGKAGVINLYRRRDDQSIMYFVEHSLGNTEQPPNAIFDKVSQNLDDMARLNWQYFDIDRDWVTIKYYTEYNRDNTIFRSHPEYRSQSAWHDWVIVRWSEKHPTREQPKLLTEEKCTVDALKYGDNVIGNRYCYTPCKIKGMFFHVEGTPGVPEEFFSVVWPTTYDFKKSSVFSTKWTMDYGDTQKTRPMYSLINCNSIVRHSLMFPEHLSNESLSTNYHEIWPRELWGNEF